ncbi:hypothetical protein GCM10008938_12040 [Deinococcus roseus]|uniref:Urease accessory protein UreJ n=2 Tax=Deinococcus roseus TaxID=392414 RepID=A0ABQ2CWF0_9DEIO|nr:hypothetical protein GCM10008938_12040 [Deinococcus roseus]
MQGFSHPLTGLDHLLAMVAVGIWATQLKGKAVWAVPATFVLLMLLGGVLGMLGMALPFVETGILASVLLLGLLILLQARFSLMSSMALVGLFAVFHGHAHGAEMPATATGLQYALGFVLATAGLHLSGLAVSLLLKRLLPAQTLRYTGLGVLLGGLSLMFA